METLSIIITATHRRGISGPNGDISGSRSSTQKLKKACRLTCPSIRRNATTPSVAMAVRHDTFLPSEKPSKFGRSNPQWCPTLLSNATRTSTTAFVDPHERARWKGKHDVFDEIQAALEAALQRSHLQLLAGPSHAMQESAKPRNGYFHSKFLLQILAAFA